MEDNDFLRQIKDIKDFWANANSENIIYGIKFFSIFLVFVFGVILEIKITRSPKMRCIVHRNEWKREVARSKQNVITGRLIKSEKRGNWKEDNKGNRDYYTYYKAVYSYTIDGIEKNYKVTLNNIPPQNIELLYLHNPGRLFTYEEDKREWWVSLIQVIIAVLPFIVGVLYVLILGVDQF